MIAMTAGVQVLLCVAALLLGVAGSALFAGLETGTYVLNKVRLELRAAGDQRRAQRLSRALRRPRELLSALLIATNASHYLVTVSAVLLFSLAGSHKPQLYATVVVTPLLFVLGEMLPKNLFRVAAETLTYRLSWLVSGTMGLCRWMGLSPAVLVLSRVMLWPWRTQRIVAGDPLGSRQRVHSFLAEGHADGVLTSFQSHIASRVVEMPSTTVNQVMVELPRVASIPVDCPRRGFLETLAGNNYSRLAVWRDRPDNIVGIVNVYDVLYDPDPSAVPAAHVREPVLLAETLNVAEGLVRLQCAHRAMGLVANGAGQAVGIVTIKDLVEEIVGELEAW